MQAMKRFYKQASTDADAAGWVIKLDSRTVRSPAGAVLTLPSSDLAMAVADEWQAQGERIEPATMPLFSLAVTVVDRVISQHSAIISELVSYGGNDLLCYRADDDELARRQQQHWCPWVEWAGIEFNVNLRIATRITPAPQPAKCRLITGKTESRPIKIASWPGLFMLHHIHHSRRQCHHRQRQTSRRRTA